MERRALLTGGAVWLVVVVVVSVATWTVIDAAGRDVTTTAGSDPAAAPTVGEVVTAGPTTRAPGQARAPRVTVRPSPRTTGTPGAPGADDPVTSAPAAPTTGPGGGPGGAAPGPSREPQAPAPVRTRTWNGAPGTVTAQCQGGRVSLVSASPAVGWRMEIDKRGPEEVEVKFHGADGSGSESESEDRDDVEVEARCAGGAPVFRAD